MEFLLEIEKEFHRYFMSNHLFLISYYKQMFPWNTDSFKEENSKKFYYQQIQNIIEARLEISKSNPHAVIIWKGVRVPPGGHCQINIEQ